MKTVDLTPLLEPASAAIADFTVGFARFTESGPDMDAVPAGSGTLVSYESLHGILTAAHVLDHLPTSGGVGIIQYPRRQGHAWNFSTKMEYTDRITLSARPYSVDGPDLAFLRLTSEDVGQLKVHGNFYNLTKRRNAALSGQEPGPNRFAGVSGMIGAWTIDLPSDQPYSRVKGFRALFGVGVEGKSRSANGYDLIEFEADYGPGTVTPDTFGGASGGGLWRIYYGMRDGVLSIVERRLIGVAFYESGKVNDRLTITCHGARSVYGYLLDAMSGKWRDGTTQ